jgi:Probable zinc-ribbon domain
VAILGVTIPARCPPTSSIDPSGSTTAAPSGQIRRGRIAPSAPRYWYVDTIFPCGRCDSEFTFSAAEQRIWYEEHGFWIDSLPRHCLACRRELRELKTTRQEYDRSVEEALHSADPELKKNLTRVIDQLYELGGELPARINENRRRLARQLSKLDNGTA